MRDRAERGCFRDTTRASSIKRAQILENAHGTKVVLSGAMPRGPRANVVNGVYHVMTRGNAKMNIFADDRDRRRFVDILADSLEEYAVIAFFECRIGNHYHLIVKTPRANLPDFMEQLNGGYARYFNRRHRRIGHLFNERHKPVLLETGFHLRIMIGYVATNPVKHRFVNAPGDWEWSSYRAAAGLEPAPHYLSLSWLSSVFPASCEQESRARFVEYLRVPTVTECDEFTKTPFSGSSAFERDIRNHIEATFFMSALPRSYRELDRPPLEDLFSTLMTRTERNRQMLRAHVLYAYKISEVARALNMNPGSVSRIVAALRRRGTKAECE